MSRKYEIDVIKKTVTIVAKKEEVYTFEELKKLRDTLVDKQKQWEEWKEKIDKSIEEAQKVPNKEKLYILMKKLDAIEKLKKLDKFKADRKLILETLNGINTDIAELDSHTVEIKKELE